MKTALTLALLMVCGVAPPVAAQSAESRPGLQAGRSDVLQRLVDEAAAKGLPSEPLTNKIREGAAKNVDPKRIEAVVRQLLGQLETAERLIRENNAASEAATRNASIALLGEAIGSGVTEGDVRDLRRVAEQARRPLNADGLANAARGAGFIREAGLPPDDGLAVIGEAVRQGYQSIDVLNLGREVKRREADYRSGRASLRALRDQIARGERPEQLFRAERPETVERPAGARTDTPVRPERPARPEPPVRPERPATRVR